MKKAPKKFFGIKNDTKTVGEKPQSNHVQKSEKFALKKYGERILICFVIGILLMTNVQVAQMVWLEHQDLEQLNSKRAKLVSEKRYWQMVIAKYPQYRDAYLKLATIAYQVGEKEQAKMYIEKVFALDPNSMQGMMVEREMGL